MKEPFQPIYNKNPEYIIFLLLTLWLLYLCITCITIKDFWFDESGQFWMGLGLNHYSPFNSSRGSLIDVFMNNAKYNLDPGLFTFILYFWTFVSTDPLFLRLLPCTFYIISIIYLYKIVKLVGCSNASSAIITVLLMSAEIYVQYGFELRAYSANYCGIFVSIYYFFCFTRSHKIQDLCILNALLSLFCITRYSFFIFAFSICLVTIFIVYKYKLYTCDNFYKLILAYSPFVLPISYLLFFIFVFGFPPTADYIKPYMIYGKSLSEIYALLITLFQIKYIICAIFYIYICLIVKNHTLKNMFLSFLPVFLLVNILFFILSALGKHPWAMTIRWGVDVSSIFTLSAALAASFIAKYFEEKIQLNNTSILHLILAVALLVFLSHRGRVYTPNDSTYTNISANIERMFGKKVIISVNSAPTVKYIFEHTFLKNFKDWYSSFKISGHDKHINCNDFDYAIFSHDVLSEYSIEGDYEEVPSIGPSQIIQCKKSVQEIIN